MSRRISVTIAVLSLTASISASAADGAGFYAGLGVGRATNEVEEPGLHIKGSDTSFKLFTGYSFNRYFAGELVYLDAGSPSGAVGPVNVSIEARGFIASMVGKIPFGDSFSLFGKVGYAFYDSEATARQGAIDASSKESNEDLAYGIGAAFEFGKRFGVRTEYEMVDVSKGKFRNFSVSGVFRF